MRYAVAMTIFFTLLMMSINLSYEVFKLKDSSQSIDSIYKEDPNLLFLLDPGSSFYQTYSIEAEPPYLPARKLAHFFVFGFLALLIYVLLPGETLWKRGWLAFISASIVGALDEMHQYYLVNRSGRLLDVVINLVGTLTFILLVTIGMLLFILGQKLIWILRRKEDAEKDIA
ncbi:VanZ family protein [Bacillus alkalicellulosilyticus]|uniref:VanZ family protein n=1 Tax=Alkalihalobacterium alkalicellulosilyticum TaxID=1912214 RepID=UPI00099735D6|nr:VanZ family protein [Bacillus alkalicellulosilyticus]